MLYRIIEVYFEFRCVMNHNFMCKKVYAYPFMIKHPDNSRSGFINVLFISDCYLI